MEKPFQKSFKRLLINDKKFEKNLKILLESVSNLLEIVDYKKKQCLKFLSILKILDPLQECLQLVFDQFNQMLTELLKEHESIHIESNYDGRGSWSIIFNFVLHSMLTIQNEIEKLNCSESVSNILKSTYLEYSIIPIIQESLDGLKIIIDSLPSLLLVTFWPQSLNEEKAHETLIQNKIHPFWYDV